MSNPTGPAAPAAPDLTITRDQTGAVQAVDFDPAGALVGVLWKGTTPATDAGNNAFDDEVRVVERDGRFLVVQGKPGALARRGVPMDFDTAGRWAVAVLSGDARAATWAPALVSLAGLIVGSAVGRERGEAIAVPADFWKGGK